MYYRKVGESRNSYSRLIFLNEMLSGQDTGYIDNLMEYESEPPLRFHPEACYMAQLGLKKSAYAGYYHLTTNEYMEIYVTFERMVLDYFRSCQVDGEIFLTLYYDKQIMVLFSISQDSRVCAGQVFDFLQDSLQRLYQDSFLKDGIYCNQTFVLTEPVSRSQIPSGYRRLQALADLGYFLAEPGIVSPETIRSQKQTCEPEELRQLIRTLFQAVNDCDSQVCGQSLADLFLHKIKYSFDSYLLEENLVCLKQFYSQICNVYDIPMETDLNSLFDRASYPKLEQLAAKMQEIFLGCMEDKVRGGKTYSRIVRECIQILKADFCRPDISLTYVAKQINISPSYLSSAFNREMHSNITHYIIRLRMDRAKELLKDRRLNIGEIATAVGIENQRYFSESFKKDTGLTPTEFRESLAKTYQVHGPVS